MPEEKRPIWINKNDSLEHILEGCHQELHLWEAKFYQTGHLAYWACEVCGKPDREIELQERLDWVNGWIDDPPRLVFIGPTPPKNTRMWALEGGEVLKESDPSTIHFIGLRIPELEVAHTYRRIGKNNEILEEYKPIKERLGLYSDHYWLTRYQVVGTELVRHESHCFEESTYDIPNAKQPKKSVVISGLRPLTE